MLHCIRNDAFTLLDLFLSLSLCRARPSSTIRMHICIPLWKANDHHVIQTLFNILICAIFVFISVFVYSFRHLSNAFYFSQYINHLILQIELEMVQFVFYTFISEQHISIWKVYICRHVESHLLGTGRNSLCFTEFDFRFHILLININIIDSAIGSHYVKLINCSLKTSTNYNRFELLFGAFARIILLKWYTLN